MKILLMFVGVVVMMFASPALAGDLIPLPPELTREAADAALRSSGVELVTTGDVGLIDRSPGPILRLDRIAYEAASDDGERSALLALALSYRIGTKPRGRTESAVRDLLANVVGPTIEDNIEERRGRDPRQPTTITAWPQLNEAGEAREQDRVALRGVAWAGRLGVCEAQVVRALGRVAALGARSPGASRDARRILKGLGTIRFNPDSRCST